MSSPSSPETGRGGEPPPRRVALLGSTGSIGRQAVDVLAAHPDAFRVVALATGSNAALLAEQAARLRPAAVALGPRRTDGLDLPAGTERVGGHGRPRRAGDARRRRPGRRGHRRRREPATGPGRAARGQGRRHGQQGDPRRGRPPGHAAGPGAGRGVPRPARPTRSPARWPGSARSTRSTRPSGSASSANR